MIDFRLREHDGFVTRVPPYPDLFLSKGEGIRVSGVKPENRIGSRRADGESDAAENVVTEFHVLS
ncbi:hypothetical protein OAK81_02380, partial [Verrucomicrobiales bacterium]|nr:hypothetical protein [Verrucomicrobiales bacterium]